VDPKSDSLTRFLELVMAKRLGAIETEGPAIEALTLVEPLSAALAPEAKMLDSRIDPRSDSLTRFLELLMAKRLGAIETEGPAIEALTLW
jgi:hypothetical protein